MAALERMAAARCSVSPDDYFGIFVLLMVLAFPFFFIMLVYLIGKKK